MNFRRFSTNVRQVVSKSKRLREFKNRLAKEQPVISAFIPPEQASASESPLDKYSRADFSEKGIAYLNLVNELFNKKYDRGGSSGEGLVGIEGILEHAPDVFGNEIDGDKMLELAPEIQALMRVKVSSAYLKHALEALPANANSMSPILKVVVPDEKEILYKDIGETDPSNQNKYSPMPGLLHKYNMLLAMTSINCSSHCRYCYRSDLFNGSSGKSKTDMNAVASYVKAYNRLIEEQISVNGSFDAETGVVTNADGEPLQPVREILLSGGDVMNLVNSTLARYLVLMAEAGIKTIRLGSKELVFNPSRFDENFFSTMDLFHQNYPDVRIELVGHYVHPYELVQPKTDLKGNYVYNKDLQYTVHPEVEAAIDQLNARRSWFGHHNQFPLIAGVNDSPEILRLLLHLTNKLGIVVHNVYACREVKGNPHFRGDLTIPRQYDLLETAKIGLSGIENHARLIMSTEQGKMDVLGYKEGKVYLRLNRFVHERKPENTMIIVDEKKLDESTFYWLTQEVIDTALDHAGMTLLNTTVEEDTQLIKNLKLKAAASVAEAELLKVQQNEQEGVVSENKNNDNTFSSHNSVSHSHVKEESMVKIEIRNKDDNILDIIDYDLSSHEVGVSLAEVLENHGHVEMVCGGSLSCTTCVGSVTSDGTLPEPTLDERDATDSLVMSDGASRNSLRACCQLKLNKGRTYAFSALE